MGGGYHLLAAENGNGVCQPGNGCLVEKIVGYHVHDSLHTRHVACAFKMALAGRRTTLPLVHHSDRGIQYCSQEYQALHQRYGITCSMTDGYDCYQNALAEG